jgi:hypothetical protein
LVAYLLERLDSGGVEGAALNVQVLVRLVYGDGVAYSLKSRMTLFEHFLALV